VRAGRFVFKKLSSVIALTDYGQYTDHMQAVFQKKVYNLGMTHASDKFPLKKLREAAGLSVRELARRLDIQHSTVLYWESSGSPPRSNVLVPMAQVLGVTVEELLGEQKPRGVRTPGGRLGEVFDAVSRLPRRQQKQIIDVVEAFVEKKAVS
jgi:transcriptional regulator with XRE-family HTH domain